MKEKQILDMENKIVVDKGEGAGAGERGTHFGRSFKLVGNCIYGSE